jgi:hypothetical protein
MRGAIARRCCKQFAITFVVCQLWVYPSLPGFPALWLVAAFALSGNSKLLKLGSDRNYGDRKEVDYLVS